MAQRNMHCALRRNCSNIQKDVEGENSFLSPECLEPNTFNASLKGCEASSVAWKNPDQGCSVLTFFALQPNGQLRIVALPLQRPDHTIHAGSGSEVNMGGVHLVSPSPVSLVKGDQHKAQSGFTTDKSCSASSLTANSFSGSNFQRQSQNKGLANKEDKAIKRNSRKNVRKKGKRNKKILGDAGLPELEHAHQNSTSDTGVNKDIEDRVGPLPDATVQAVSLPEHSCSENTYEGNSIKCHAKPNTCASCIDEVDTSETLVSSLHHHLSNSESGLQTNYPGFSILNEEVQKTHCKPISSSDDPYTNVFCESTDSLVLDSVSLGSNSDKSCNNDFEFKVSNKEGAGIDHSKSQGFIARKVYSSPGNMVNGVVDANIHGEGVHCGWQGCITGDRHSQLLEKREKQIKRVPKNSSVYRVGSVGNLHGRFGKENNSVWQKVHRNDADECKSELEKVNLVSSQFDIGLKEAPSFKKHLNVVGSSILSNSEDKSQTKVKVSGKLKRKSSTGSKQEYNCYSRKGSHAIKACSNLTRINKQRGEISDTPAKISGQKELDTLSRSHSKTGCPRIGFQTKRVESITFKPAHSLQVCPNELEPLGSIYTTTVSSSDRNAESRTSSLSRSCNSLDPSGLLEELSAVHLHTLVDDDCAKEDKEVPPADHSQQDTSSGAIMHKWIPISVLDSGLPSLSKSSGLSIAKPDELAGESQTLQNIAEEELASDSHTLVSSINSRVTYTGKGSKSVDSSPSEDVVQYQNLGNQTRCISEEYSNNHAAAKCLIPESKDNNISASENYLSMVVCAVNNAHRTQLASEAIQKATGCPIAEFERLLHSASPVICPSQNIASCWTCSRDLVMGASLCRHETPNVSLGSLWQWYEEHCSYGLEVRAEDYENLKRLRTDRVAFRAYFVPFLSAIQLFRKCKGHNTNNGNGILGTEAMEASEMHKTAEKSPNIGRLPIFSVLVPQPRTEDLSYLEPGNHYYELSSECTNGNAFIEPVDYRWSDDMELLFEYFESEQPQKRRTLFEMIKELVRGDGPSECRTYGDPTILDSMDLRDLHPRSWYSVAWYPIYRIPDGNFRAAFLTYHSLGHLVHRGFTFDSPCRDACIVSPVVGLQSYNTQGECWFQLRNSKDSQRGEVLNSNHSGILEERLRTLEQTASLMARAVVSKGSQTYMNRQPDYEFFISRRRW